MGTFLTILLSALGGFLIHSVTMKVSFKQNTIERKIKVYDSIICQWIRIRNHIVAHHPNLSNGQEFDQLYSQLLQFVAEALLICEDTDLTRDLESFTEELYRREWANLNGDALDQEFENVRSQGRELIHRMRQDVKITTLFEKSDIADIVKGLFSSKSIRS